MSDKIINKEYIGPDGDIGGDVIELWRVTFERPDGTTYTKRLGEEFLLSNKPEE